jgi:hypothetical protein
MTHLCDMPPSFAEDDFRDCRLVQAIMLRKRSKRRARRTGHTNVQHVGLGQLCATIPLACGGMVPALRQHVGHVVGGGAEKKVVRANTAGIVAAVANVHTLGYRPIGHFVGKSVRPNHSPLDANPAISASGGGHHARPASTFGPLDFRPKARDRIGAPATGTQRARARAIALPAFSKHAERDAAVRAEALDTPVRARIMASYPVQRLARNVAAPRVRLPGEQGRLAAPTFAEPDRLETWGDGGRLGMHHDLHAGTGAVPGLFAVAPGFMLSVNCTTKAVISWFRPASM